MAIEIAGTLGTAPGAAQIVRTANIRWTQRAALVVRGAADDRENPRLKEQPG